MFFRVKMGSVELFHIDADSVEPGFDCHILIQACSRNCSFMHFHAPRAHDSGECFQAGLRISAGNVRPDDTPLSVGEGAHGQMHFLARNKVFYGDEVAPRVNVGIGSLQIFIDANPVFRVAFQSRFFGEFIIRLYAHRQNDMVSLDALFAGDNFAYVAFIIARKFKHIFFRNNIDSRFFKVMPDHVGNGA